MKPFLDKDICMGCKACGDACPKQAIAFPVDAEGFWHPEIDSEKCIDCHLCERVCPVVSRPERQKHNFVQPEVYAAYHKNHDVRYDSTSGGMYYALAENILARGGWLAGCVYTADFDHAEHIVSNTKEGLKRIMRSKYFQSDTDGIYKKVKELLLKKEIVLFCGAPCQVAALYKFLGREYSNLYTVDFICRGINTPLAYQMYMKELIEEYSSPLKEVRFKDKSHGWTNLGTKVIFANGQEYYRNRFNDPWVNGFISGDIYMRPSCAACHFKEFPRIADITIGDFWGIELTEDERKYGLSLAMVNSGKGCELFDMAKESLVYRQEKLARAVAGNPALLYPAPISPNRKRFFEFLQSRKYSEAVWETMGLGWPKWKIRAWILQSSAYIRATLGDLKRRLLP